VAASLSVVMAVGLTVSACGDTPTRPNAGEGADAGEPVHVGPPPPPARILTIAGKNSEESAFADGDAADARFALPEGLVLDATGENLFIADMNNHAIRRLELGTMKVTTVAGVGTHRGSNDTSDEGGFQPARLHTPRNLVLDPSGTSLYFTDTGNYVIRRLDLPTAKVTTVFGKSGEQGAADGVGNDARFGRSGFGNPWGGGMVIDSTTDPARPVMYVADSGNSTIRSIDLTTREVKTIAGEVGVAGFADGMGLTAKFNKPSGLVLDGKGKLFVTEANNIDIRQIDLATMAVTTVAGKAPGQPNHFCENISPVQPPECGAADSTTGIEARFRFPFGVAPDQKGGFYLVDSHNNLIRHFDMTSTAVATVAGVQKELLDDIPHASAESSSSPTRYGTFWHPTHVAFKAPNILFVADRSANCIRRVELGVY
jgi:sugar lactone lactonase YvrE